MDKLTTYIVPSQFYRSQIMHNFILHLICSLLSCSAIIAIRKPIFSNLTCLEIPIITRFCIYFCKNFLGDDP